MYITHSEDITNSHFLLCVTNIMKNVNNMAEAADQTNDICVYVVRVLLL